MYIGMHFLCLCVKPTSVGMYLVKKFPNLKCFNHFIFYYNSWFFNIYIYLPNVDPVNPPTNTAVLGTWTYQSWALPVFFHFFYNKNDFFALFIKLITVFCTNPIQKAHSQSN